VRISLSLFVTQAIGPRLPNFPWLGEVGGAGVAVFNAWVGGRLVGLTGVLLAAAGLRVAVGCAIGPIVVLRIVGTTASVGTVVAGGIVIGGGIGVGFVPQAASRLVIRSAVSQRNFFIYLT